MSKQQQKIAIALAWLNGTSETANEGQSLRRPFTLFKGYPLEYSIWNINYVAEREFIGQPTKRALSGFERAGISGYRLVIDLSLTNTNPDQTNALKQLLDASSSQYIRRPGWEFKLQNFNYGQSRAFAFDGDTLDYPFTISDSLANTYVYNKDLEQLRLVKRFFSSDNGMQFEGSINGWLDTHDYEFQLLNNQPTIWGIGFDTDVSIDQTTSQETWAGGYVFCNLISSQMRLQRELTVGTQAVNMQFRSVERFKEIPIKNVL